MISHGTDARIHNTNTVSRNADHVLALLAACSHVDIVRLAQVRGPLLQVRSFAET